jgi:thioesterase domain-containing protein
LRNDIRAEFQPLGPYILIGYSFGGLIALEMAQRLTEEGKQVALLTFVDTYPQCAPYHAYAKVKGFYRGRLSSSPLESHLLGIEAAE